VGAQRPNRRVGFIVNGMGAAACGFLLAMGCGLAAAAAPEEQADLIASFIEGRFVMEGSVIYRAARVSARIEGGKLSLKIEADPLYTLEQRSIRLNSHGGTALYENFLPGEAKCGLPELRSRIEGTHIGVKAGERFLNLREALEGKFGELPSFESTNVPVVIGDTDLKTIRACAKEVAAKADAIPFAAIRIYAGDSMLAEIARTTSAQPWGQERELGDDQPITRVRVEPKSAYKGRFSVQIQAISVMSCSYEGPHIELDGWKRGLSPLRALRADGRDFLVDPALFDGEPPKFPGHTRAELHEAIRAHWGVAELSPEDEPHGCAPFLRGHRFVVKYGSRVVQEIFIYNPGGC
jgi:hypothetical protein